MPNSKQQKFDALPQEVFEQVSVWLGEDGYRFFSHLEGLTGTVSPVLKLNAKRKGIPVHPVHFREGMQVRNFLRGLSECKDWTCEDFDDLWPEVVHQIVEERRDAKAEES